MASDRWRLTRVAQAGDIVTEGELRDVELALDWKGRVRRSKFADMPRYGREPTGHIALQDHGDWVAYRNIKIRVLGTKAGG